MIELEAVAPNRFALAVTPAVCVGPPSGTTSPALKTPLVSPGRAVSHWTQFDKNIGKAMRSGMSESKTEKPT